MGQSWGWAVLNVLVLLLILYLFRYVIASKSSGAFSAMTWYTILLGMVLPFIWLFVDTDWDNEAVSPLSNWVGSPVALLFVPTAFLCFDLLGGVRMKPGLYLARSLLEVMLIPVWAVAWFFCEFLLLGWIGP
jgi:hypothetical protein